jgi:beta-N-acetylhexosaminidase
MLKKQVGELFILGYQGLEPSDKFLRFVEKWGIGGIIIFSRNIDKPENLLPVIKRIEQAAGKKIFAAIDQEGGLVMRILSGGSLFPSAMGLAAIDDENLTESVYKAIGLEMKSLGLNWNLAPVLDINHPDNPGIGARAFGDNPHLVARHGCAAIRGLQNAGVLACAKHFPGKGAAKVDSHLTLPVIPSSKEELEQTGLLPFKEAILQNVAAIMTAHVFFPAFESSKNLPATLSKSVLTDLLRKKMQFEGILITDDLEMGAITEKYGIARAALRSFLAGADQLLICHSLDQQNESVEQLFTTLKTDTDLYAKFQTVLGRIAKAKAFIQNDQTTNGLSELKTTHSSLIEDAHLKSVRCIRKTVQMTNLDENEQILFLYPEISALVQVEEIHNQTGINKLIKKFFPNALCVKYNPKDSYEIIQSRVKSCLKMKNIRHLVFYSYNLHLFTGQRLAASALADRFDHNALIALRNPYDLEGMNGFSTLIAAFSFRTPAITASLLALTGKIPLNDSPWPVNISDW